MVKLKPYNNEDNDFEDLLQLSNSFEQELKWAKVSSNPKILKDFRNSEMKGS